MHTKLLDDANYINEILKSGVEGIFLLDRGYTETEIIDVLHSFKHREHLVKEVAKMSLQEREGFYEWHCGQYREDIPIV